MTDKLLALIGRKYPLTRLPAAPYSKMKVKGMNFLITRYTAKGLGSVSVMRASGLFGLMKMDTLIVTPTEIDMPLLSYDRVSAMGNDTLIFELYDTFTAEPHAPLTETAAAKAEHSSTDDHDLGEHWYDHLKLSQSVAKKSRDAAAHDALAADYLAAFLSDCDAAAPAEAGQKREKSSVYVEGLLQNGGPSTDVFKKALGDEKTADLFRRVLFATAE